jgi:hypothetical protein
MEKDVLKKILRDFKKGKSNLNQTLEKLKSFPLEDLGFAKIDTHRALRCGVSEVIFCQGKRKEDVLEIVNHLVPTNHNILATRAEKEVYKHILKKYPRAYYNERAKVIVIKQKKVKLKEGLILVITGGTADIPVAEEAAVVAEVLGNRVERLFDVGVAGIHRLLKYQNLLFKARVIIVVAGMEGALPSVVAGLVDKPVIGVPTSIGYGVSLGGVAPLFTMLNSCAAGLAVVNIDNGFGAGFLANSINQLANQK